MNHPSVDTSASLKPADLQAASDIYQQILNVNVLGPTLVTRAATNLIDHTIVSPGNRGTVSRPPSPDFGIQNLF